MSEMGSAAAAAAAAAMVKSEGGSDEWMNGGSADASSGHPSLLVSCPPSTSGQAHPPST